ncbi:hypothetical protein ZWY2020_007136 [Hordeum vulgare]|nr:hypothetical protein ZWY2020_007136 [Hordeum vulgare]
MLCSMPIHEVPKYNSNYRTSEPKTVVDSDTAMNLTELEEIRGTAGIRILVTSDAAECTTLASLLPRPFGPHDLLPKDAPRPRATRQPPRRSRRRRRQWLRRQRPRGAPEGRRRGCGARDVQRVPVGVHGGVRVLLIGRSINPYL